MLLFGSQLCVAAQDAIAQPLPTLKKKYGSSCCSTARETAAGQKCGSTVRLSMVTDKSHNPFLISDIFILHHHHHSTIMDYHHLNTFFVAHVKINRSHPCSLMEYLMKDTGKGDGSEDELPGAPGSMSCPLATTSFPCSSRTWSWPLT